MLFSSLVGDLTTQREESSGMPRDREMMVGVRNLDPLVGMRLWVWKRKKKIVVGDGSFVVAGRQQGPVDGMS